MTEGKHVLVVDDEPMVRQLLKSVLATAGYSSEEAADGLAAIERLKTGRRPDLILLDLIMPRLDGWGVLEHVSAMADPPPVLLVSGMHEVLPPGHLNRYVTGFICKPFDVRQLLETCAQAVKTGVEVPAGGTRGEARRTFLVETTLVSEGGRPLTRGQLTQLSQGGFRAELAVALEPGDRIRVTFKLPPRLEPVTLVGRIRWRTEFTLGAQIESASEADTAILRDLIPAS